MSKKNKKANATIRSFSLSVKPVPAGKVSLAEFIGSEAGQQALNRTMELENTEKSFAILCAYQTYETCVEILEAGRIDLLENESFQEYMVDLIEKIVRENFIEMLMAVGGELSNLIAEAEKKGGV